MSRKKLPLYPKIYKRLTVTIELFNGTPCWVWQGCTSSGYGKVDVEGRLLLVHRVMYELFKGAIPKGLHIDHLCRNRSCCNPYHLEPVTPRENVSRGKQLITHCPQGHPYNDKNTRTTSEGKRQCKECHRIRMCHRRKS